MIMIIRGRTFLVTGLLISILLILAGLTSGRAKTASMNDSNYRVFVAGLGTVEGKWCRETGIAIIGLETRPAADEEEELKVVDLLVANGGSSVVDFDADITLINSQGKRYGIKASSQPKVQIKPGSLSQGTIIINVPKGTPDKDWLMEIKGGHLKDGVILPLRVVKVKE